MFQVETGDRVKLFKEPADAADPGRSMEDGTRGRRVPEDTVLLLLSPLFGGGGFAQYEEQMNTLGQARRAADLEADVHGLRVQVRAARRGDRR